MITALIVGLPAIIGAIYAGRIHGQIRTPSGKPIGQVTEYAHDTVIANNMLLSHGNGATKRAEPGTLHTEAEAPPLVPDEPTQPHA